jgi:hypothetical protein
MLEEKQPLAVIFRLGRKPDPWRPPDWSRANPDGTFGNRFDDPQGYYRVLYAATQELSCFLETLARFRPDLSLLAELEQIDGENDFFPLGEVPQEWCDQRLLGSASATGSYADIYAVEWIEFLRRDLANECLRLGLEDLDAGILQRGPRRITQLASRRVYERGLSGICYLSRYGHNLENWALFEPFPITPGSATPITPDNPMLTEALRILGLRLAI